MDLLQNFVSPAVLFLYVAVGAGIVLLCCAMAKLIRWAKRRPAGAYFFLALMPLISLFPIPPAEIKKLQQVKQEQVERKQEAGEPPPDEPTV